ncbi:MAG: YkgJ family cysteine cluster protein [Nanoarchaeota archaeon]|nr:YkgJ family cysteine cluster protein [Nanoarchaeota archaeon]
MTPESIANKARNSLKDYCFLECNAYCCRKGYLVLNKKEYLKLDKQKDYKILEKWDPTKISFTFFLGSGCPALCPDFKCKIHKSINRPSPCKEFPIFIKGNNVILSGRCLAVRQGKFYPYINQWTKLGLNINITNSDENQDLISN